MGQDGFGRSRLGGGQAATSGTGYVRCGKYTHLRIGRNWVADLLLKRSRNQPEFGRQKTTTADLADFDFWGPPNYVPVIGAIVARPARPQEY